MGQSLPLALNLAPGSRDPRAAEIRWRDGRDGEQSRHFVLLSCRITAWWSLVQPSDTQQAV
jgi:hypothetical protein